MEYTVQKKWNEFLNQAIIFIIFILGIWLVVLKAYGPHWKFVPGDIGDTRLVNYLLEHFFRRAAGLENDYWNASYFYPFKSAITFSENLLGSAPIYAFFRWGGLDRETSFQWWYLLGFCLNYAAASYVLSRLKFNPLATGMGAFFFTFGLPILAQETHPQLLYRFAIPLACFALYQFFQTSKLSNLSILSICIIWQFYLSIYMGVFLAVLLLITGILLPFSLIAATLRERLACWPKQIKQAWLCSTPSERMITAAAFLGSGILFILLMWPYYQASIHYGFFRSWGEVYLPDWKDFFSAGGAQIWYPLESLFINRSANSEQRLFPGIAIIALVLIGVGTLIKSKSKNASLAWLNLVAALAFILFTLNFNGHSGYWFLWHLPGLKSIRVVGRIQLVLMWPIALFIAWVIDEICHRARQKQNWLLIFPLLLSGLLIAESVFFDHVTHSKLEAQQRLARMMARIPKNLPDNPILFIADNKSSLYLFQEIDTMLLAQEIGMPTLNGYSGNFPPGYEAAANCIQIPKRIIRYMKFENITQKSFYLDTIKRIVPVGFDDCDSTWWEHWPY